MFEAITAKVQQLLNRIGQSTDTANANGNVNQKIADLKGSVGNIGDPASQTGTIQAIIGYIKNTINTINSNMATATQATNIQNSVNAIPTPMKPRTTAPPASLTVSSTTSVNLINYSGAGRLIGIVNNGSSALTVSIIIDGNTIINGASLSAGTGLGFDGGSIYSSNGTSTPQHIPALDMQFKSSCQVQVSCPSGSSSIIGLYEHE